MNPYEADTEKIPTSDRYIKDPLYGRYLPAPEDFKPDPRHINSTTPESLAYWASILEFCDESNRLFELYEGNRNVFALGSVIIKSSHLLEGPNGRECRDYTLVDANEVQAIALARQVLGEVRVPEIYFAGKIDGWAVLVQERIPGVALEVAWPYLSQPQKASFKQQARNVLKRLHAIRSPHSRRSYVVPDPDPYAHRGILELEEALLFSANLDYSDMAFMHNDLSKSNIIVDNDKIVGVIDWEMAGYFGRMTAAEVHIRVRSPNRESYAALDYLKEDFFSDLFFWNDLYYVEGLDERDLCRTQ